MTKIKAIPENEIQKKEKIFGFKLEDNETGNMVSLWLCNENGDKIIKVLNIQKSLHKFYISRLAMNKASLELNDTFIFNMHGELATGVEVDGAC